MIDENRDREQEASEKKNCKKVENYIFSYEWKLGEGSFSEVFKGIDSRTNNTVAVKVIKIQSVNSKVALTLLQQEISILKELDHSNVIRCYDVLNSTNNCYIVTEFCKFGDLEKLLKMKKKFCESEIASFVYHIFKGLQYLSEKKIIHRDFKIANVFVGDNGVCKIADFGFAVKSDEQFKDISLGSPIYMAPEAIINKEYGPKTDIWAFGALIYELICGRPPLSGIKTQEELREKIVLPPPLITEPISTELKNFIDRCLTISVKNRISIQEMEDHEYMRKIFNQFESEKLSTSGSMSMSETKYSSRSSKLVHFALEHPISYEEAVGLLQYCRLLSKVCQCVKSQVLEQWLLKLIYDLNKTKLKENQMIDYARYYETVSNYCSRYYKDFKDRGIKVKIDDVLKECEDLLTKEKKYKPQIMAIGTETNLLREALFHPLKLVYFSKTSNASGYMSSS